MKFSFNDSSVRLTGRWDTSNEAYAETTATGSYIELCFEGERAMLCFDVTNNITPLPHLWIQVDGGAMTDNLLDSYIWINAGGGGKHYVKIIFKSAVEAYSRWYYPRHAGIRFVGFGADSAASLEPDTRSIIEFVGDSITEGVLTEADYCGKCGKKIYDIDVQNRAHQDDVCSTYAYMLAQRLNFRQINMGYGAVGTTKGGQGKVPCAQEAYTYNFDGSPIDRKAEDMPRVIMINHGANDRNAPLEKYLDGYEKLLDTVIEMNPEALVISLSAFCGAHHEELGKFIVDYNERKGTEVEFIDSFGWVPLTPLHPLRAGHTEICDKLTPLVKEILKKHNIF